MAITTGVLLIAAPMYIVMAPFAFLGRRFECGNRPGLGPGVAAIACHLQVVTNQRPAIRFGGIIVLEDRAIERRCFDVTAAAAIAELAGVDIIFLMAKRVAADVRRRIKVLWRPAVTALTAMGLCRHRVPAAQRETGDCVVELLLAADRRPARNVLVAAVLAVAAEAEQSLAGQVAVQPATQVHPLSNLLVASQTLGFRQHAL